MFRLGWRSGVLPESLLRHKPLIFLLLGFGLFSNLGVDDFTEGFECRVGVADLFIVHEEGRRAVDPELVALGEVGLNSVVDLYALEIFLELIDIEPESFGVCDEVRFWIFGVNPGRVSAALEACHLLGVVFIVKPVVHFPEFTLQVGCFGSAGAAYSIRVQLVKWEVSELEGNPVTVFSYDLFDRIIILSASRALIVTVFSQVYAIGVLAGNVIGERAMGARWAAGLMGVIEKENSA
jgi:hypothetical protein